MHRIVRFDANQSQRVTRVRARRGSIVLLSAVMLVVMVGMLAFAIDLGYVYVVKAELQRSADSAALAAVAELISEDELRGEGDAMASVARARARAIEYAAMNPVARESPLVAEEDVEIGYLADPLTPGAPMTFDDPALFNAVNVRVLRSPERNGNVSFFFAKMLGVNSFTAEATSTAAVLREVKGFRTPGAGGEVLILPFALDRQSWDEMLAGDARDDWGWHEESQDVAATRDGILEVNLYPQSTGAAGNRGTVKIGHSNNSTSIVSRQILHGISGDDFAYHGGTLELDADGQLELGGDPGISAGFKDELAAIRGETRIVPLYASVRGNGNNTVYTIVRWVGIRVMEVQLTGNNKRLIVQPANVPTTGAVGSGGGTDTSQFINSALWLAR